MWGSLQQNTVWRERNYKKSKILTPDFRGQVVRLYMLKSSFDKTEHNIFPITDGVWRIFVPFEDLFTTVYVEKRDTGVGIIDSATYSSDVDDYILPALCALGIDPDTVEYIALTHTHTDHAGGAQRLAEICKNARVYAHPCEENAAFLPICDGEVVGGFTVVHLPGHTKGTVAFLDRRERILLSGDCLQLGGVGKYRSGVVFREDYLSSVRKLKAMDIRAIVAAHEYDPLGSTAIGRDAVKRYLDECERLA